MQLEVDHGLSNTVLLSFTETNFPLTGECVFHISLIFRAKMAPNNPQTSWDILQRRGSSTLGESSVNPLHICHFGALPPLAPARQLYDLKEIPSWHPSIFREQVKHRLERKEGIHSNSPSELWGDFCAYCTLFKCFRIFVWTEKPFKSAFCWFPFDFLPNITAKVSANWEL